MEASIITGSVMVILGVHKALKKIGIKVSKRKLKRLLVAGFDELDLDMIKRALVGLADYDEKHETKKREKYVAKIVRKTKNDPNKQDINEELLKEGLDDLTQLKHLFDDEVSEVDNVVSQQLDEITRLRKEVQLRSSALTAKRRGILRNKPRRNQGRMG